MSVLLDVIYYPSLRILSALYSLYFLIEEVSLCNKCCQDSISTAPPHSQYISTFTANIRVSVCKSAQISVADRYLVESVLSVLPIFERVATIERQVCIQLWFARINVWAFED